jgi:tRNA/rRNA methyltransferase
MQKNYPQKPLTYAQRTAFVMLEPSHAGNIGAAARALRSMGFADLRVVAPRHPDFATHPDAIAFASGATQILNSAQIFTSLEDALHDVSLAVGLSAQGREFCAPPTELQTGVHQALLKLEQHEMHRIGFVFGTERTGLTITQAQRCHHLCFIESDELSSSLNVAQSIQVVAYSARLGYGMRRPALPASTDPGAALVSVQEVDAMLTHLEQALVAIEFLNPEQPKRLMPRLRRQFNRSHIERSELDIWRGIASAMLQRRRDRKAQQ